MFNNLFEFMYEEKLISNKHLNWELIQDHNSAEFDEYSKVILLVLLDKLSKSESEEFYNDTDNIEYVVKDLYIKLCQYFLLDKYV